jgi:uncharacterized protein YunC (DUF1805 family)
MSPFYKHIGALIMLHKKIQLTNKQANGYIIPLGTLNLITIATDIGMIACGAFNAQALDNFNYPAVLIKSKTGDSLKTIEDLLEGTVKEANNSAITLGIEIGITGKQALKKM